MGEPSLYTDLLAELCRQLISSWDSTRSNVKGKRSDAQRLAILVSLAQHTHRSAKAFMELDAAGYNFEAMALARSCYEMALRVQWIRAVPDGPEAWLNEHERQAGALYASAKASGWITDPETIAALDSRDVETLESRSSARSVQQMCDDLAGAEASGYTLYRAMSTYAHPSAVLAERYLWVTDGEMTGFRAHVDPEAWDRALGLFPVAVSLVWAGRAVDSMDPDRTRRSQLRTAAKLIGVPDHLELSEAAWLRINSRR